MPWAAPARPAPPDAGRRCPRSLRPRGRANSGQPGPGQGGVRCDADDRRPRWARRWRRAADRAVLLDADGRGGQSRAAPGGTRPGARCRETPACVRGFELRPRLHTEPGTSRVVAAHLPAGAAPHGARRTADLHGRSSFPAHVTRPSPAADGRPGARTPGRGTEPDRPSVRPTRDKPRQPLRYHTSGALRRATAPHGRKVPLRGKLARRILPNSACQGHNVTGFRTHPRAR